jgi:CRISPR system Cascade subunit CasE
MTAWLVRIRLDSRDRNVRRDLRDVVNLHRTLMSTLPHHLAEQARRDAGLLFRLDDTRSGLLLLVQSRLRLDLDQLPAGYGLTDERSLQPMLDGLTPGRAVQYRLAGNASKRLWKADEHRRSGQVVALNGLAADQWWIERAPRHGLQLQTLRSQPLPSLRGQRGTGKIEHGVTRYDGTAIVDDIDAVREAVLRGIGRAKPYGCGLLSLAPVRAQ